MRKEKTDALPKCFYNFFIMFYKRLNILMTMENNTQDITEK